MGSTSLWERVVGGFRPLSKATTRRGDGQPWTSTHGFFIQMGGFVLYENEYPKEVLDVSLLYQLLHNKAIDTPIVTERDLQDRSKGDSISKAIIVLQTTWFMVQCIARAAQGLPLSELEVLTLAFAVMNAVTYAVWWNKPQGVEMAICVPLKRAKKGVDGSTTPLTGNDAHENLSRPEIANLSHPEDTHSNESLPSTTAHEQRQSDDGASQKPGWLQRMLRKDYKQYNFTLFFFFRLPYRIATSIFLFWMKMGPDDGHKFNTEDLRVPMFYKMNFGNRWGPMQASCVTGIIFGAIHLLAWASKFPSPYDLVLWRVSAIIVTAEPVLVLGSVVARNMDKHIFRTLGYPSLLLISLYIVARFVLIGVALRAIHHPPSAVLRDVVWTSYIPHL